jgi:hypothetical protein
MHVVVTFNPTGDVEAVSVDKPGNPAPSCVAAAFQQAHVPAFAGQQSVSVGIWAP